MGGYFIGKIDNTKTISKNINTIVSVIPTQVSTNKLPTQIIPNPTSKVEGGNWGTFSQEYINNYTFGVTYPLDKKHEPFIFNSKNSGWPISVIEQLFIDNISFGDYRIGISDIDPTTCYTSLCMDTIDSISKEEGVVISNIPSRKITAIISQKGGGIILPEKQTDSILYIIPYQNKYFILFSFYPDSGFEKFASSFKVRHN